MPLAWAPSDLAAPVAVDVGVGVGDGSSGGVADGRILAAGVIR